MNKRFFVLFSILICGGGSLWSQQRGYVLKPSDGEKLFEGTAVIKASPKTGSQGAEMIWSSLAAGDSSGVHVHHRADEFFYVIRGTGSALVGGKEVAIEAGDVVFVPKGQDHRLKGPPAGATEPLEVVFFVDRSGLASEYRESQVLYELKKKWPPTLEELNRISQKYGTTYKTLQ